MTREEIAEKMLEIKNPDRQKAIEAAKTILGAYSNDRYIFSQINDIAAWEDFVRRCSYNPTMLKAVELIGDIAIQSGGKKREEAIESLLDMTYTMEWRNERAAASIRLFEVLRAIGNNVIEVCLKGPGAVGMNDRARARIPIPSAPSHQKATPVTVKT